MSAIWKTMVLLNESFFVTFFDAGCLISCSGYSLTRFACPVFLCGLFWKSSVFSSFFIYRTEAAFCLFPRFFRQRREWLFYPVGFLKHFKTLFLFGKRNIFSEIFHSLLFWERPLFPWGMRQVVFLRSSWLFKEKLRIWSGFSGHGRGWKPPDKNRQAPFEKGDYAGGGVCSLCVGRTRSGEANRKPWEKKRRRWKMPSQDSFMFYPEKFFRAENKPLFFVCRKF